MANPERAWHHLAAAILLQAVRDAEQGGEVRYEARQFLAAPMARQLLVELGMEPGGLARFRGEPVPEQLALEGFSN